jgi:uncharacterized lipoprotein YajG
MLIYPQSLFVPFRVSEHNSTKGISMKRILLIAAVLLLFSGCAHKSNNVKREFSIDVKQGNNYNVGPVVETSYKVTF